ncbi:VIR protein [Plasmodium vivax]|uniref:VIR protein n=1 Tax=Plasmodium vivax TaxID=5855 RepID=A0A1G4EA97_PLAVI|nr:VIR protein [Plasmodium vivax]
MYDQRNFENLISLLGYTPKDFFSEKFYKNLYNDEDIHVYYQDCSSLGSIVSRSKRSSLKILCKRLVKYLKTEYIPFDKSTHAYDECILLNYWVYSRLVNILGSEVASTIAHPFAILQQIWNDIVDKSSDNSRNNICKPDDTIILHEDWRKRQELYDYYVNYSTIEKTIPIFVQACPEYWTYVERHNSLFEYFNRRCSEKNYKCPEFYDKCKKYDPKDVLHNFPCNTEMMDKKAKDTLAKSRSALPENIHAGQEENSGMPSSSEVSAGGSHLTRDGSHPVEKTGNILLGVVATSLASGALYRFTPLGNMLRNGFGRNNNSMRNMHGDEYGLFDYATESYNPFTGGGEEHHIGYQPT